MGVEWKEIDILREHFEYGMTIKYLVIYFFYIGTEEVKQGHEQLI